MPSENNRRRTPAFSSPKSAQSEKKTAQHSPFAGCTIIGAAGVVMVFLVGFTIWSLLRVTDAMESFTQETAAPTPILDPAKHETAFNDLARRLDGFQASILAGDPAELALSALDINLAIAAHEPFKDLRSTFYVQSITERELTVQISYPINGKPLGDGGNRYLNGTFYGVPVLDSGHLLVEMRTIDSLKGDVPDQFVAHLSDHQITAPYLEDPVLGPLMKKLTGVKMAQDALILTADPAKETPGKQALTRDEFEKTKVIALVSLGSVMAIISLFLFIFLNRKDSKTKN